MKNRDNKIFAPDTYHHVFNRGNRKMDVFLDDEDKKFFLFRLKENLSPQLPEGRPLGNSYIAESHTPYMRTVLPVGSFTLLSYSLMPNHFHLEIRQNSNIPVSKLILKICTSYSIYFNKKYESVGHVFQDRFKSVMIESDTQLLWLSAYIHNNPKVAGLVEDLKDYQWSSYLDYIGQRNGTLCDKSFIIKMLGSEEIYKLFVEDAFKKIKEHKDLDNLLLD